MISDVCLAQPLREESGCTFVAGGEETFAAFGAGANEHVGEGLGVIDAGGI
jgi:hypothetical protein